MSNSTNDTPARAEYAPGLTDDDHAWLRSQERDDDVQALEQVIRGLASELAEVKIAHQKAAHRATFIEGRLTATYAEAYKRAADALQIVDKAVGMETARANRAEVRAEELELAAAVDQERALLTERVLNAARECSADRAVHAAIVALDAYLNSLRPVVGEHHEGAIVIRDGRVAAGGGS